MRTLCLTGWQQSANALEPVVGEALYLDYSSVGSVDEVADQLLQQATHFDRVVGWSLGGQIALSLIDKGILHTEKLVLVSTPWQIVQSRDMMDATPPEILDETIRNYKRNPQQVMESFMPLIIMGDQSQKHLTREYLGEMPAIWKEGYSWLKHLKNFSCAKLRFDNMPASITLIHGDADVIAPVMQVNCFREKLPSASIYIMEGCAHAPHWHDPDATRELILSN